jgi:hypothetical protein
MEIDKLLINTTLHAIVSEYSHFFYSCMRVKFTLRLNDQGVIKVFMFTRSIWIVKQIFVR